MPASVSQPKVAAESNRAASFVFSSIQLLLADKGPHHGQSWGVAAPQSNVWPVTLQPTAWPLAVTFFFLPPQAFSHFTFERSGHQLIVVDIQGVGDLYTDPQIHTEKGTDFGDGNLGRWGNLFPWTSLPFPQISQPFGHPGTQAQIA